MFRKFAARFSTHRENSPKTGLSKKRAWIWILALVILAGGGGFAYYRLTYLPAQTAGSEPAMQTATVRRGDLVIYASGSGTLIASDEVALAFQTGGKVTEINVNVGDQVKVGDVLAKADDTSAQIAVTQAKRNQAELTSLNAIATAQGSMATATTDLASARDHLAYIISPAVMHWEEEVAKAEQAVKDAQAAVDANPSDKTAQQNLKDAQATLARAQASLNGAQATYVDEYLSNNFTVKTVDRVTRQVTKYVAAPTESDILSARAAVTAAQAALDEATWLYAALTGGEVPQDATGSGLGALEQARLDLQSAQNNLDGTRLIAPIAGTVMSVDTRVGDTVGTSTAVISVADLSQPVLEVFLDASDWTNIRLGYKTEVTFDILPDTIYNGVVTQVDPGLYAADNTLVVRAIVKLDPVDGFNLPLSTTASVDVIGGEARNAVLVPIEALRKAGDQYTVFVVENGKLKLRVVEVGIQDLLYAEIISGLEAGEVVSTGITVTK